MRVFAGDVSMRDDPIENTMRDAKITQIDEGTNPIQREETSKILVSERIARSGLPGLSRRVDGWHVGMTRVILSA